MTRNILILEDKKSHMEALMKIVSELHGDLMVFTAVNVENAYGIAMEHHIHIFLLDIILCPENPGDVSGLKFAQEIRGVKKYTFTPLIFITSLEDPKLYSYSRLQCFGYLEKPFRKEQVSKILRKALEFPIEEEQERYVYFRKDSIVYSKCIHEIVYIEISRRKVVICCKNDILEIPYKTCREIMKEIDSNLFVQCSRNMILNKKYIEEIDYANRYVKMKDVGKLLEIGTIMKKHFKNKMGVG